MKRFLILVVLALLLIGCSSQSNTTRPTESVTEESYAPPRVDAEFLPETPAVEAPIPEQGKSGIFDPTKIVKTGSYNLETKTFDETIDQLNKTIEQYKGFSESSSISGLSTYPTNKTRTAYLSVRIPSSDFDAFRNAIKTNFSVTQEETSSTSVADSYYDSENRIKVLETQQTRLLALMDKAESLDEVILLQQQLMNVEYDLEYNKGIINRLDNQIDYSTIRFTVVELEPESVVKTDDFMSQLSSAFSRGFSNLVSGVQGFILGVAENIVLITGFLIVLFLGYRVLKRKPKEITQNKEGQS